MLTMMLGQKLGAKAHVIPAPVIVRNRSIRDTLFKEGKIQQTLEIAKKADLVLFGVGYYRKTWVTLALRGFCTRMTRLNSKKPGRSVKYADALLMPRAKNCLDELDDRTIGFKSRSDQKNQAQNLYRHRSGESSRDYRCI